MTAPVIIGAGPAGTAAAITLARAGARPLLLDRQREAGDALCGGFLSWRTLDTLARLGLPDPGGHPVDRLRLFAGDQVAEAPLPRPAAGLSRARLDAMLRARAIAEGAVLEGGVTVKSLEHGRITLHDGSELAPGALFVATGKHDLRGLGRPRDPHQTVGIRVRLAPGDALTRLAAGAIELHLFRDGYCGLVLQEGGRGNLCLAVRRERLRESGGTPMTLLRQWAEESPHFADRLALVDGEADAIGAVPYGWIARTGSAGLYRLGDQAAVIPSLAGEGNGIALASGMRAARAWLRGEDGAHYQAAMARAAARPVRTAWLLWRLAEHPWSARRMTGLAGIAPWLAGRLAGQTRIAA